MLTMFSIVCQILCEGVVGEGESAVSCLLAGGVRVVAFVLYV